MNVSRMRRSFLKNMLAMPTAAWVCAFFLGPLLLLLLFSFASISLVDYTIHFGWTFENYRQIFSGLYFNTIGRSLLLSIGATLGCLVIGFPFAYAISRQKGRRQTLLLVAVMIPFWTSFVVRTYGLVNLLDNRGPIAYLLSALGFVDGEISILYTPWSIAIGMVYTYLPMMVLPLFVALDRVNPVLLQAASDLGAKPHRVFRRVLLPQAAPGIAAGCLLVGIPATGEYVVPEILGGGKTLMYGNVIANQVLSLGNYPFGAALSVSLTTTLLVIVLFARRRGVSASVI